MGPHRRTHDIAYSEKGIMLCKAAVFQDHEMFEAIAASNKPETTKAFGRKVRNFDEEVWQSVVCSVAFEVCLQKFSAPSMARERAQLLSTAAAADGCGGGGNGNASSGGGGAGADSACRVWCVEAAPRDCVWGVGIGLRGGASDAEALHWPSRWRGTNVLGWALTKVRDHLLKVERCAYATTALVPSGLSAATQQSVSPSPSSLSSSSSHLSKAPGSIQIQLVSFGYSYGAPKGLARNFNARNVPNPEIGKKYRKGQSGKGKQVRPDLTEEHTGRDQGVTANVFWADWQRQALA